MTADWDGYGSPPVRRSAIEGAMTLLGLLQDIPLPPAHVSPVPGGGVQIDWESAGKELELEFRANGTLAFLATDPAGEREGTLSTEDQQELWTLLVWLSE